MAHRSFVALLLAGALSLLAGCHSSSHGSGPPPGIYCHATVATETVCYGYSNLDADQKSAVSEACTESLHGTISGSCPSGELGCCTTTTGGYDASECYYAGSAEAYESGCTDEGGKWTSGDSGGTSPDGGKGQDGAVAGPPSDQPPTSSQPSPDAGYGPMGSCSAGQTECPLGCVNESSDVDNCGSCGYSCPAGPSGTTPSCTAGRCTYTCADPSQTLCGSGDGDGDAECVDLQTSMENCGQCFQPCYGSGGASASCQGGVCQSSCPQGQAMCGGECTDTVSNTQDCGGCGIVCSGDTPVCSNGSCTSPTCTGTQTLCSGECVNTSQDAFNCGSCGNACQNGNFCAYGACSICPEGTAYCAGLCPSIESDPNNCGGCGNVCSSGSCVDGACQ